jgi:hypothetical protein
MNSNTAMKGHDTRGEGRGSAPRRQRHASLVKAAALAGAIVALATMQQEAGAGPLERAQAKRMFDRLTGTPPSPDLLDVLEQRLQDDGPVNTALFIMSKDEEHSNSFYNVTLKNFAAPWTNRDQTVFAPLNDYTATVIGIVRDGVDFRKLLYEDIIYVGDGTTPAYSSTNNDHYDTLESNNRNLKEVLVPRLQSQMNGLPPEATAGIITSRAAAEAFFIAGTNRAMFRFTLLNHLCRDMEQMLDTSRPPDRIRQDVTRSPGGDSSIFQNNCVGCHNGMDPMAQAFAYYNFDEAQGRLVYTPGQVQPKYLINSDNFKPGFVTTDDRWDNRWRLPGQGALLGWDPDLPSGGYGAKSLGKELAYSEAFAQCQVEKVFRHVCLRSPKDHDDRTAITNILAAFKASNYKLTYAFAGAAAYCAGP